MIRDICKDEFFLSQRAEPATADDLAIAQDLLDTLPVPDRHAENKALSDHQGAVAE